MQLTAITFKNWRCFYGEQQITFCWREFEEDGHVTVVHAQNGFGKPICLMQSCGRSTMKPLGSLNSPKIFFMQKLKKKESGNVGSKSISPFKEKTTGHADFLRLMKLLASVH